MGTTRQISLPLVAGFGGNLRDALKRAGIPVSERSAVCEAHVSARCSLCGAEVSGRALAGVLLSATTAEASQGERLARLRLGYCVNTGCQSAYYEFSFEPHAAVDWSQIPAEASAAPNATLRGGSVISSLAASASSAVQRHLNWRMAAALAILLAVWILHQWVTGGTIPLIREGRTFTSDVPPPSDTMPDDENP